jgi:DNA-binding NarL/FixJ family response regulator
MLEANHETRTVRVLLYDDCSITQSKDTSDYAQTISIVGTVRTGEQAITEAASTLPDAMFMLTDRSSPTTDFARLLSRMHRAALTDRVAILAKHPASYLRLAVKTRAAALLPMNVRYDDAALGISDLANVSEMPLPTWQLLKETQCDQGGD